MAQPCFGARTAETRWFLPDCESVDRAAEDKNTEKLYKSPCLTCPVSWRTKGQLLGVCWGYTGILLPFTGLIGLGFRGYLLYYYFAEPANTKIKGLVRQGLTIPNLALSLRRSHTLFTELCVNSGLHLRTPIQIGNKKSACKGTPDVKGSMGCCHTVSQTQITPMFQEPSTHESLETTPRSERRRQVIVGGLGSNE